MRTLTMTHTETLKPAHELAQHNCRLPNDRDDYRKARLALLVEEIELRRRTARAATQGKNRAENCSLTPVLQQLAAVDNTLGRYLVLNLF